METVSAAVCNTYDPAEVLESVRNAVEMAGFTIPEGKTVLIKPNVMSQNRPEQHSITHYSVVDAICVLLKEKRCRIWIGESGAFYQKGLTAEGFRISGIAAVAEKYGAELLAFEEQPLTAIPTSLHGHKEIYIARALLEADLVIDACKLKSHASMRFSGAIKNMFGCVPGGMKQKIHIWADSELALADVFLDIHESVRPSLSIMDAVYGLDGGPSAIGTPVRIGRIFASTNAAALDTVTGRMIGYEPLEIPALVRAKARGMIGDFDEINVIGSIEPVRFKHLTRGEFGIKYDKNSIFVCNTYIDVKIDESRCSRCGRCAEICPAGAITGAQGAFQIERERCVNCYYCMHICPEQAILEDPSAMNRFIRAARCLIRI